jgi:hypothetical protein
MITYSQSFKTKEDAEKFLSTFLHKEEFIISKVANDGGDIYFIEPIIQLENSELSKLSFTYGIDPTVIKAILKKASEK